MVHTETLAWHTGVNGGDVYNWKEPGLRLEVPYCLGALKVKGISILAWSTSQKLCYEFA